MTVRFPWPLILILACLMFRGKPAFCDGGVLLLHKQAGGYLVSVFGAPAPLRAGPVDLSVLIQRASDGEPVLDTDPILRLSRQGQTGIIARPTHAQATNKLLYAALIDIPADGVWNLAVAWRGLELLGSITVLAKQPAAIAYWPYFAVVPAAILLFAINQRLKRRRRVRNPLARP